MLGSHYQLFDEYIILGKYSLSISILTRFNVKLGCIDHNIISNSFVVLPLSIMYLRIKILFRIKFTKYLIHVIKLIQYNNDILNESKIYL